MATRTIIATALAASLCGCASGSLNTALGTPKNPEAVLGDPEPASARARVRKVGDQTAFLLADYAVLRDAIGADGRLKRGPVDPADMRHYLGAGFNLGDLYCARYFKKTDEASRRRRFGRALTNDVGTAVSTVLGLVNAGEAAVTAVAAGVGLADSSWRNYDDSFLISPDLANVRALVLAAQDNFRAQVLRRDDGLPNDYGTAQSTVQRYADLCSHLGMRALLDQSTNREQASLRARTEAIVGGGDGVEPPAAPAPGSALESATATPPLAANRGD